jgi:hypothetical protein
MLSGGLRDANDGKSDKNEGPPEIPKINTTKIKTPPSCPFSLFVP